MHNSNRKKLLEKFAAAFDQAGHPVYKGLQDRTIGISLEQLGRVRKTIAVATGKYKAKAILAALKAGFINYLVTDKETMLAVLALDEDIDLNNVLL